MTYINVPDIIIQWDTMLHI